MKGMICSRAHSNVTSALPDSKTTASGRLLEGARGVEEVRTSGSGCPGLDAFPGPPLIPQLPGSCAKAAPPGPASTLPVLSLRAQAQSCFRGTLAATRPLSTTRRQRPPFQHPAHTRTPPLTHSCRHKHAHATRTCLHTLTHTYSHTTHTHTCRCPHRRGQPTRVHMLSHTHAHVHTRTHLPHVHTHSPTDTKCTHIYTYSQQAGMHTRAHTPLTTGGGRQKHTDKSQGQRHAISSQESSAAQATPDPGGPSVPPSLWFPAASGCPLAAPKPQFQCHVPPVACNFSSLPSPLQSSCLPQHPLPGDHRTQTPASKQGLFPNDLMRFPLWRLSQSHWQDPPPLGGDMGTEAFHCPSNQRVCVSSSISSQGVAQRRIP